MEVDNDTSTPVNYEQSGGGTGDDDVEESKPHHDGNLPGNGGKNDFTPAGRPPWTVKFWDGQNSATSSPFSNASATVTLNSNWTVTVS